MSNVPVYEMRSLKVVERLRIPSNGRGYLHDTPEG